MGTNCQVHPSALCLGYWVCQGGQKPHLTAGNLCPSHSHRAWNQTVCFSFEVLPIVITLQHLPCRASSGPVFPCLKHPAITMIAIPGLLCPATLSTGIMISSDNYWGYLALKQALWPNSATLNQVSNPYLYSVIIVSTSIISLQLVPYTHHTL